MPSAHGQRNSPSGPATAPGAAAIIEVPTAPAAQPILGAAWQFPRHARTPTWRPRPAPPPSRTRCSPTTPTAGAAGRHRPPSARPRAAAGCRWGTWPSPPPAPGRQVPRSPGSPRRAAPAASSRPVPAVLIAAVGTAAQADRAIAAGADMIDAAGLSDQAVAAIRARHPRVRLWAGSPAAVGADGATAADGRAMPVAAVVARAAVLTWLGTPAIRTGHVLPVRRAIDMTSSIAGTRLPSLTTRGLG